MKSRIYLVALVGLAMMLVGSEAWAVCYVDQNAKGKNNGSSWGDAYVHPQLALINGCTEIWVAKGVYTPVLAGSDPTVSFDIPAGTKLYGGFAGGETAVEQRLPLVNLTVLTGDVDHNDALGGDPKNLADWAARDPFFIKGKNSNHIVTMRSASAIPISANTVLDGFILTGGDAASAPEPLGGAIYCSGESPTTGECSPSLANLIFIGNTAGKGGGAIAFSSGLSRSSIANSLFLSNGWAPDSGGAILSETIDPASWVSIAGCMFFNNYAAKDGGAIKTSAKTTIVNTTFFDNTAFKGVGGAIDISGIGPLSVVNTTFSQNFSRLGGNSIANELIGPPAGSGAISIFNSIFWGNSGPAKMDIFNQFPNYAYAATDVLEEGCPDDVMSICINILEQDPKLNFNNVSTNGELGLASLLPGVEGSAINAGDDSSCAKVDERGVVRPQGPHCDIGAFEWRLEDDIIFRNNFQ